MLDLIPWKKRHATGGANEHSLSRLRDDFNSLTERFFGEPFASNWPSLDEGVFDSNWGWRVDVDDSDDEFVVRAEAPGFDADEFDVQVTGNQLVIQAEQKQESENDHGSRYAHRSFHRSMSLPAGAEVDKIDASYKNGILEIHLPKGEQAKAKRIEVKPS